MIVKKKSQPSVLIVDDERNTRDAMARYLRPKYEITMAEDGISGINLIERNDYDLILTDLRMPGADGMSVLEAALKKKNPPPCIVFTAYGSIESAVSAVKSGAFDFVTKPVNLDRLEIVINRALEAKMLKEENRLLKKKLRNEFEIDSIVAKSAAMQDVLETVRQVAPTRSTVLISGESGSGKEVVAKALHLLSGRKGVLMAVHCAALPPNLLESELFGHEKGAFTGAVEQKKGRFELADNGTLFLDEIGEIEPQIQVKLLRVLETRTFERVGGVEPVFTDTRLISATNRDLRNMVAEGKFREDLFYRLDVVNIHIPPLRERQEDIPILIKTFIDEFAEENGKGSQTISEEALSALCSYKWPGNIRELRNCIERMVVLSRGPVLRLENVPVGIRAGQPEIAPATTTSATLDLDRNEKMLILKALEECGGNRTNAAEKLGISRRTLHRKLKEYSIN
ncbi:MAG: sigma-54-dependent transcriptional regulator [Victivallaceae bacterium]